MNSKKTDIELMIPIMREMFKTFGVKEEIESIIKFYKENEKRLVFSSQLFEKIILGTGNEIEIEFLLFIKTLVEEMIKERRVIKDEE